MSENRKRQFVAIKFDPGAARTYTYHNDGEPIAVGDEIVIPTKGGNKTVKVAGLPETEPPFRTAAIIGKAPPK